MDDDRRPRPAPQSSTLRRALAELQERAVNFSVADLPEEAGAGWRVDRYRHALPSEPPGPPVPGGSWTIARRVLRDYEFADPGIVRAVYHPDAPLENRTMLLIGRFFGLRFRMGVRIGDVLDETREVDGRPVRVWGWDYKTLEGHLEAGQMDYEVWKWLDTGDVEFRMRRFVRAATTSHGIVRVGWMLFGRWMQQRFVRRACVRMDHAVRREQGLAGRG